MWSTVLCEMQMFIDSYSVKYQKKTCSKLSYLSGYYPLWVTYAVGLAITSFN